MVGVTVVVVGATVVGVLVVVATGGTAIGRAVPPVGRATAAETPASPNAAIATATIRYVLIAVPSLRLARTPPLWANGTEPLE
ncbi:MAG: hypothetical protein NVSMB12_07510 [Acidimicrobiales bacterium]